MSSPKKMPPPEKIVVERIERSIIEKKLLESLDDRAHVAIVLSESEIKLLIGSLALFPSYSLDKQMARQMREDLLRLKIAAFGR